MKCHQGYKRSYPGAAESNILQQKLRKLVKYGLRGKRKVVLKKSNDNDSSRTYFLKEDDGDTGLFVKINNAKKVKKQGLSDKLNLFSIKMIYIYILIFRTNFKIITSKKRNFDRYRSIS